MFWKVWAKMEHQYCKIQPERSFTPVVSPFECVCVCVLGKPVSVFGLNVACFNPTSQTIINLDFVANP